MSPSSQSVGNMLVKLRREGLERPESSGTASARICAARLGPGRPGARRSAAGGGRSRGSSAWARTGAPSRPRVMRIPIARPATCGVQRHPARARASRSASPFLPQVGREVDLREVEASRPAGLAPAPPSSRAPRDRAWSAATWNTPWPTPRRARGRSRTARPRRRRCPGDGLAVDRACGASVREVEKPERARAERLAHEARHGRDVVGVGGLVASRRARPSRRRARRRAGPGRRRRSRRRGSSASRYSGKDSQPQRMPSARAEPGMSSTPSMSPMSQSRCAGSRRGEADAAVAHDDRGDTVPRRRA
jgi:hypothetical protein